MTGNSDLELGYKFVTGKDMKIWESVGFTLYFLAFAPKVASWMMKRSLEGNEMMDYTMIYLSMFFIGASLVSIICGAVESYFGHAKHRRTGIELDQHRSNRHLACTLCRSAISTMKLSGTT